MGRTGSGKSSLFNVLFRMVEQFSGSIVIDGVDINGIELRKLRFVFSTNEQVVIFTIYKYQLPAMCFYSCFLCRGSIAIIPQSPFLFSGTIRENLDPCQLYTDDEIWQVLEKCHLKAVITTLGGLSVELAERGKLFSIGQSQLLCLARAMLLRPKVRSICMLMAALYL